MTAVTAAVREQGPVVGMVAAAAALGLVLTAGATRVAGPAAPAVLVAVVLLPLLAVAALLVPWLAVAYVVASIPVGDTGLPVFSLQIVQAAAVAAAGIVVLRRFVTRQVVLEWSPPLWWFLAFVAWTVVALPSAADQAVAMRQTLLFAGELLFAAVVVSACATTADVRRVLGTLLVVAVVVALTTVGSLGELRAQFGGALVEGRAEGVFNQPNELGTFSAVALLVAAGMALGGTTRGSRRLAAAAMAVIGLPLVFSLSRGSWIGAAAGLATLVVMLPAARRLLLSVGVPLLLLGLAIGSFAPSAPEVRVVSERAQSILGERNPYDDRPHIWAEGRRQALIDPWTGQGPGSFPVVAARSGSETVSFHPEHAHNLLLTFAAESGLPAAALFLGMAAAVAGVVRRAHRLARAAGRVRDSALIAGLTAALVAVFTQGLIDYSLRAAVIFTEIAAVLGALLALTRVTSASAERR